MTTPVRPSKLRSWVPIRSLGERHRQRIEAHLVALAPRDRWLRFGHAASELQIAAYVTGIDFDRDEVFGIFDRRLRLIALTHLAYACSGPDAPARVEFGVSVLEAARGRGYASRLFEHAVMHARNRGTECLLVHALTENQAMLHIARKAGASVERDGSESQAWLKLPPDTLATQLGEVVGTHAAEVDYRLKRHALQFGELLEAVGEVREQMVRAQRDGSP